MSLFFGAETKSKEDANAFVLGLCWDKNKNKNKDFLQLSYYLVEYVLDYYWLFRDY